MGNVMENGNKKEKVITRMAAYDWLKVMGTLMVVIRHYYAMFPNGSQLPLWSSGTFQALAANGGYAIIFFFAVSGYMLMKHYYDRSGEESFSRYITPKIQRLWPLHFSTMLFFFELYRIYCRYKKFTTNATNNTHPVIVISCTTDS